MFNYLNIIVVFLGALKIPSYQTDEMTNMADEIVIKIVASNFSVEFTFKDLEDVLAQVNIGLNKTALLACEKLSNQLTETLSHEKTTKLTIDSMENSINQNSFTQTAKANNFSAGIVVPPISILNASSLNTTAVPTEMIDKVNKTTTNVMMSMNTTTPPNKIGIMPSLTNATNTLRHNETTLSNFSPVLPSLKEIKNTSKNNLTLSPQKTTKTASSNVTQHFPLISNPGNTPHNSKADINDNKNKIATLNNKGQMSVHEQNKMRYEIVVFLPEGANKTETRGPPISKKTADFKKTTPKKTGVKLAAIPMARRSADTKTTPKKSVPYVASTPPPSDARLNFYAVRPIFSWGKKR